MSGAEGRSSVYAVPALEKGLDILEALSLVSRPMSLTELSRTLQRSSSEIFRMVNCLEQRGYIVKDEYTGCYSLSLKLFGLAHRQPPVAQLLRAAELPMRRLAADIRESCHLSMVSDHRLVVLAQAESPQKVRLSVEVGASFSAIGTASGRMLLAAMDAAELEQWLAADAEYQALEAPERLQWQAALAEVRKCGYSAAADESHYGVKDLAVLIGAQHTGIAAALATGYMTSRGKPAQRELLSAVKQCAADISKALGL